MLAYITAWGIGSKPPPKINHENMLVLFQKQLKLIGK